MYSAWIWYLIFFSWVVKKKASSVLKQWRLLEDDGESDVLNP